MTVTCTNWKCSWPNASFNAFELSRLHTRSALELHIPFARAVLWTELTRQWTLNLVNLPWDGRPTHRNSISSWPVPNSKKAWRRNERIVACPSLICLCLKRKLLKKYTICDIATIGTSFSQVNEMWLIQILDCGIDGFPPFQMFCQLCYVHIVSEMNKFTGFRENLSSLLSPADPITFCCHFVAVLGELRMNWTVYQKLLHTVHHFFDLSDELFRNPFSSIIFHSSTLILPLLRKQLGFPDYQSRQTDSPSWWVRLRYHFPLLLHSRPLLHSRFSLLFSCSSKCFFHLSIISLHMRWASGRIPMFLENGFSWQRFFSR